MNRALGCVSMRVQIILPTRKIRYIYKKRFRLSAASYVCTKKCHVDFFFNMQDYNLLIESEQSFKKTWANVYKNIVRFLTTYSRSLYLGLFFDKRWYCAMMVKTYGAHTKRLLYKTSPLQNVSLQNVSTQNVSVIKPLLTLYLRKLIFSYPFKPLIIPVLVICFNASVKLSQ
jgi:Iap family predicted aminopeptidase